MNLRDRQRLERHVRRVEELRLWRNSREQPIEKWRFAVGEEKPRKIRLGDVWPEVALPIRLSARAQIPREWEGQPVELELWLGGVGFVRISNGVTGGLNPFHRSFPVASKARGGDTLEVEAEVVPKGIGGAHVAEPRLTHAFLVVPEKEARALERDLAVICEACAELDDHEVVPHLLDVLDEAFGSLDAYWPSESDVAVTRYLQGFRSPLGSGPMGLTSFEAEKALDLHRSGGKLWSIPPAPRPLEPLPEETRRAVRKTREIVASRLEETKKEYPPVGRLALTGHAHLDLAWLWPLEETHRKVRRNFASVLGLMDRYPDFVFNQSSAQMYEWMEEDDPELFERVKERVEEGRWEPVGGSWVEPDCQMPGGESFIRQLFYGQRYFEERFGRRSTVAWLPDAFGFSPAVPQLLRGAGITGFFTYKLNWSETNDFPYDLFLWEGIDGSRVTAHSFENPGIDYNGNVVPLDLLGTWRNFEGKRHHPEGLLSFGWGNGGGGPNEKMLENYARLKDFPAMPRLRMACVDDFFASLQREGLPKWVGELYLELHRGTFTTQSAVKKLNREAEHRLLEAEAFATVAALNGAPYPRRKFERTWKTLLLNQFHDILPGTSIAEVYEDAHHQLERTASDAERMRDDALVYLTGRARTGDAAAAFVANTALHPRPLSLLLTEFDGTNVADASGKPLPTQRTKEGLLVHAPGHPVPGLGWTTLRVGGRGDTAKPVSEVRVEPSRGGAVLENEWLRVEIGPDGSLYRVHDRGVKREVLDGRGNRLWAYTDKPREWDAWDIDEDYELEGEELIGVERVKVVEDGPLRGAVRVEKSWRSSRATQTYRLLAGSRRLNIDTEINWHERQVLLRALFPLNVRSHEATFETMYGAVRRPTHRNTSWDATRFEACAHRFCDLSEPGYGVALLNDGRYGHSSKDNVLGISLVRGPLYPDPFADEGHHRFTYALLPHPGDWTEARVVEEAFALNSPLCVVAGTAPDAGMLPPEFGFVEADGVGLALGSLKMGEDGRSVILRLYEPRGARGPCVLRFSCSIRRAEKANLLEEPEERLEAWRNCVRLDVRPFEVLTLRVEPETR